VTAAGQADRTQEGRDIGLDPVKPIKAKVDRLRLWHSFPVRYCYEFCRVIFIIVGAAAGASLAPLAYCMATHTPPAPSCATDAATLIGGVIGLAAGWRLTLVGARIIRALVPVASRPPSPSKPQAGSTGIKDR
jgi:hypothetical protein